VSIELGRRLVAAGLVAPGDVEAALVISVTQARPLSRVLFDRGTLTEQRLEEELGRGGGTRLWRVTAAPDLIARLPEGMCQRLAAVPLRIDLATGAVEIAAAEPVDAHVASEFAFHLGSGVRIVRASLAAIEDALRRAPLDEISVDIPAAEDRLTPPFPQPARITSSAPPTRKTPLPPGRSSAPPTRKTPLPPDRVSPLPPGRSSAPPGRSSPLPPARRSPSDDPPIPLLRRVPLAVAMPASAPVRTPAYGSPAVPPRALSVAMPESAPMETPAYGSPAVPPREFYASRARRSPVAPPPESGPLSPARPPPLGSPDPSASPAVASASPASARPPAAALSASAPPSAPTPLTQASAKMAPPPSHPRPTVEPVPSPPSAHSPDKRSLLDAIARAKSREELVRLALAGLELVAKRAAVFAVRRDGFQGWACNAAFADVEAARALVVTPSQPSVLATAAVAGAYLGPIPSTPAHEGLLRLMQRSSAEVAASGVRVGGRAVMVLFADELADGSRAPRFIEDLSRAIGEALARLLPMKG
jgi:Type II secretion system (T2SS), protein E, N-terminal domain